MADFRPFHGWRPPPALAALVAAVPYDVVNTIEARALARDNPHSLLHVTRPDIDLPDDVSPHADVAYETARAALLRLVESGALVEDPARSYYAYAQHMNGRRQLGLIGLASADEYWSGEIKRHELTRADKEEDRLRHVRTLGAHMGPVFLTYRATAALDALMEVVSASAPEVDFVAVDGIRHQLWPITDEARLEALAAAFAAVDTLYIADGHHRAAAASRVGRDDPSGSPSRHFLACAFPHEQLQILPYYRVVKDLDQFTPESFRAALSKTFHLERLPGPEEALARHAFVMGLRGDGFYRLTLLEPSSVDESNPVSRLDVSILQDRVLSPLLNILDPRRDTRIDFVGGIRGPAELERRLAQDAAVAFALHPTSLDDLMAISDANQIMPPKSTWFEPKLRSGMVISRFRH
ncbi:MAG: DUF1015 domain-containing protein [Myxococcales bacterium]|nr:DUF1015 domain-containing protein [Myxococcales bacterium]